LTCLNELMTTQVSPVSSSWVEEAVETGPRYTAEELAALHTQLVRQFRFMAAQHRPGCAFVAPYPSPQDVSPNEILVIPHRKGAALFSIGFLQAHRTTMVVRIGEYGVVECSEGDQATQSLAATAELLFGIALSGSYREEIWTDTTTGRYEGGQSYFMDKSRVWRQFGPRKQPRAMHPQNVAMQDRRYEPY
jgi:hypothetical protein